MRGLRADSWQLYLELVEHTECLVELCLDVWHMGAKGVFVSAAVVALKDFCLGHARRTRQGHDAAGMGGITYLDAVEGIFERILNRTAIAQVLGELLLLNEKGERR